jgi:gamma-glutamyltranspeptidase/glutathione hydrolase
MVSTAEANATDAGVEILRAGGNAVDAAIAVAFALAVTFPEAGNIGGGGFLMLRRKDGFATAIDYREMAPARATRNIYLGPDKNVIAGEGGPTKGYRAAGVPGTVAGMHLAFQKYGSKKLSWARLLEPAVRLAENGFVVRPSLARSTASSKNLLSPYADSKRIYLNGGAGLKEGETLRLPELAKTLKRIQKQGWREFYEGETARLIAADMQRHNGLMTLADLKGYVAKERTPLRGSYRKNLVISMPPPSSGGIALIEMLNILEGLSINRGDMAEGERRHLVTEAMRRAFADRAEYLGDPDFVKVPVKALTDKAYAARLRSGIQAQASDSKTVRAGLPPSVIESEETTHFTVVDAEGNAIANTYTLNGAYGSGVTAAGTGILLNNEMDDFAAKPGTPNMFGLIQGEKNAVAPKKRPLSSMTPTFVCHPDGRLWFTAGSPGGPTIINTVLQIILNVVDYGMDIQQAVDAPRIHHQWLPDELVYEPNGLPEAVQAQLKQRGHTLTARPRRLGDAQAILIDPKTGIRYGASDSRRSGVSKGY